MAKTNENAKNVQELTQEQLAHAQGGAPTARDLVGERLRDVRLDFDPTVTLRRLNLCASSQPSDGPA